jgi:hypothetical protein
MDSTAHYPWRAFNNPPQSGELEQALSGSLGILAVSWDTTDSTGTVR